MKCTILSLPMSRHWREYAAQLYSEGKFTLHTGEKPEQPYDETYSEICWGWLVSSSCSGVTVTFAHGERGNDPFDQWCDGLHIWQ